MFLAKKLDLLSNEYMNFNENYTILADSLNFPLIFEENVRGCMTFYRKNKVKSKTY